MTQTYKNFGFDAGSDGIALITFDMAGRNANLINGDVLADLSAITDHIAENQNIKGAIITSAKQDFCLGADVSMFGSGPMDAAQLYQNILNTTGTLRKLESCGKPIVAAINGSALGGGLEITLACHHRIAADLPKLLIGLPEAKIGLFPGAGGTQRLPRLISAAAALPLMLQGKLLKANAAQQAGIIHDIAPADQLIERARAWLNHQPDAQQPWDKKGFRIPGGGPHDRGGSAVFVFSNAQLHKNTFGNYPAQQYIMSCVYEGLQVPIDAALRIEARYFTKILMDPRAHAMMRSLFLSTQALKKGARRPQNIAPQKTEKLGILGAGLMGAGIAFAAAKTGIQTVLIDRSQDDANQGLARVNKITEREQNKHRMTPDNAQKLANHITATDDYAKLDGADLIIEAVFENRSLKKEVTQKAAAQIKPNGIMASNTSTLPITGLAQACPDETRFIGLHFFSPVERMELVEIICGKQTSNETLARAIDFVIQIGKTPIVVNDSRGFYTSRCFGTYVSEGLHMLAEGMPPAMIENVGQMTGMPMPPLALSDAVGIDLAHAVRRQTQKDLGDKYQPSATDQIITQMVEMHQRIGKKSGKGFYDYSENDKNLWPGLKNLANQKQNPDNINIEDVKNRLLYIQALEAVRCFEENVVTDLRDADVGAILGWGFAPWTGGPISLIDIIGSKNFAATCETFAQKYGQRFNPPKLLRDMAQNNEKFYARFNPNQKQSA